MFLQLMVWLFALSTVLLLVYPIGFLWLLGRKGARWAIVRLLHKWDEVRMLDTMRKDILQKRAKENAIGIANEDLSDSQKDIQEKTADTSTVTTSKETETVVADDGSVVVQKKEIEVVVDGQVIDSSHPEYNSFLQKKTQKLLDKIKYEANSQKERGNIESYEKKLIEGLAISSEDNELLHMLADLYFHTSNHKKAFTLLKKILDKDPTNHKVIWQIGEIYFEKGELETAELMIEKAISLMPNNPKYYVTMVEIKYNKDQKDDAINLMEKVIKLRPANISYIQALAEMYDHVDDKQNAKKWWFKILEIEPNHEQAKKKLKTL